MLSGCSQSQEDWLPAHRVSLPLGQFSISCGPRGTRVPSQHQKTYSLWTVGGVEFGDFQPASCFSGRPRH